VCCAHTPARRPSFGDTRGDELEETQTLQTACFSVFQSLLGKRREGRKRLVCIRLALEFLQVFMLVVSPYFRWAIDTDLG
jgi:hypothetical protein